MSNNDIPLDRRLHDKKLDDVISEINKINIKINTVVTKFSDYVERSKEEINRNCDDICKLTNTINGNGKIGIKTEIELLKNKDIDHDNDIERLKKESTQNKYDEISSFKKIDIDKKRVNYATFLSFISIFISLIITSSFFFKILTK